MDPSRSQIKRHIGPIATRLDTSADPIGCFEHDDFVPLLLDFSRGRQSCQSRANHQDALPVSQGAQFLTQFLTGAASGRRRFGSERQSAKREKVASVPHDGPIMARETLNEQAARRFEAMH